MEEEFGHFDESAFGTFTEKVITKQEKYSAQRCETKWFLEDSPLKEADSDETVQILKYRAELAYHKKEYSDALQLFTQCLDLVKPSNSTMRRDLGESISRTQLALKAPYEALHTAVHLHSESATVEHKGNSLTLLTACYQAMQLHQAEAVCLKRLLVLHPHNPDLWIQLADAKLKEASQSISSDNYINLSNSKVSCNHCVQLRDEEVKKDAAVTTAKDTAENVNYIPVMRLLNGNCTCVELIKDEMNTTPQHTVKYNRSTSQIIGSNSEIRICLQRARYLLKNIELNLSKFANEKYKTLILKVEKQLKTMGVDVEQDIVLEKLSLEENNATLKPDSYENAVKKTNYLADDACDEEVNEWFQAKWLTSS